MKSIYKNLVLIIERFEEQDVITESPSSFDGMGYIPDSWWNV